MNPDRREMGEITANDTDFIGNVVADALKRLNK